MQSSYTFPILETSATASCGTTGITLGVLLSQLIFLNFFYLPGRFWTHKIRNTRNFMAYHGIANKNPHQSQNLCTFQVIRLAKQHFNLDKLNIEVVNQDALHFLRKAGTEHFKSLVF